MDALVLGWLVAGLVPLTAITLIVLAWRHWQDVRGVVDHEPR